MKEFYKNTGSKPLIKSINITNIYVDNSTAKLAPDIHSIFKGLPSLLNNNYKFSIKLKRDSETETKVFKHSL